MDLLGADDMKWTMRIIARFAQKKLWEEMQEKYKVNLPKGKTFIDFVHDDLSSSTNKGIRKIYQQLLLMGKTMPTQHHASMITDLGSFLLWVAYKDTAYRDPLFWMVNNIISDPDFKDDIKEYVREPGDWYCPQWIKSKEATAQQQQENLIPRGDMSSEEKRFCPPLQLDLIDKALKKQIEMDKLRRI